MSSLRGFKEVYPYSLSDEERSMLSYRGSEPEPLFDGSPIYSFYAQADFTLPAKSVVSVPLGYSVYMLEDEVFQIVSCVSAPIFEGVRVLSVGDTYDSVYGEQSKKDGMLYVKLENTSDSDIDIFRGKVLVGGVFLKCLKED